MSVNHYEVFHLSLISNIIQEDKGSVATLQATAERSIPLLITQNHLEWDVVWGPVVWKTDPDNTLTGPDHVWYVAKRQGREQYTVAVAATATTYNHLVHNSDIIHVVDFPAWIGEGLLEPPTATRNVVETGTYIALGTARGVHTLRSQPGRTSGTNVIQLLPFFLQTLPRDSEVIFTGFSLGGALSPTLALALVQGGGIFSESKKALTYPIAGASPGNRSFESLYVSKFPRTRVWNCNVINTLDIVPHAWCADSDSQQPQKLHSIPTIYGTPAVPGVEKIIDRAKEVAWKSRITYHPLPSIPFKGTGPETAPKTEQEFLKEAKKQHSAGAYLKFFGAGSAQNSETEAKPEVGAQLEDFSPDLVIASGFI
jgi:Lipase (class 3)